MTKSALAHLVGGAVERGDLRLDDAVCEHVPELRGSGYDGTRVLDVLTMTSGVDWVEDHRDPGSLASRLVGCFADGGDSRALLGRVGRGVAPATRYAYCTADSQVLDWVRERATGRTFTDDLTGLWADLGCQDDAFVGVDGHGVALAGGALAATARDWARVGQHAVAGPWADAAARPAYDFTEPGRLPSTLTGHAGFGYHWWPLDLRGDRVVADGSRGQFVAVDRRTGCCRREDLAVALRRRLGRPSAPRPQLPRTARPARPHPCTPRTRGKPVNRNVIITCALTGAGDTVGRSEHVPVTPEQIADAGIAAARAGAAIVHVHVRDPETGTGSREVALYREAVERIRAADVDVIVNTTAGMGGDLVLDPHDPTTFVEGTDLVSGVERLAHVEELLPDICTLDCGSLNFGEGSLVYVSTPDMLREGAKRIQELGVRCEMEIFDTGHLWFARTLVEEGLIDAPAMFQLCMGIPYGAPADPGTLAAMVNQLPEGAVWASFALGSMQMPWVAQSILLGGHVRVGLEDNLYLRKGVKATNAQLVEQARTIVEGMGATVATPDEAREILQLKARS